MVMRKKEERNKGKTKWALFSSLCFIPQKPSSSSANQREAIEQTKQLIRTGRTKQENKRRKKAHQKMLHPRHPYPSHISINQSIDQLNTRVHESTSNKTNLKNFLKKSQRLPY
jgi:hypothetical protein